MGAFVMSHLVFTLTASGVTQSGKNAGPPFILKGGSAFRLWRLGTQREEVKTDGETT